MIRKTKTLFREITHYPTLGDSVHWRGWVVVVAAIFFFVAVMGGTLIGVVQLNSYSCHQAGEQMGLEVEYRIPSGCYVFIDGEWIPGSKYRAIDEADR